MRPTSTGLFLTDTTIGGYLISNFSFDFSQPNNRI